MSHPALALLPYAPRTHQRELVAFLAQAALAGEHAVVESGTGTGKTVSALAAALHAARGRGLRVLYLTRTNSQARQVVREYRAIRDAQPPAPEAPPRVAVALQGRQHLCPLRKEEREMQDADAEELGVMCRDRMRAAEDEHKGKRAHAPPCRYHARGLEDKSDALLRWARESTPEAEELAERVSAEGQCPYVLARRLLPEAELVVAPYVYFFAPPLRNALLSWMNAGTADLLVIVDEAHNLPAFARDLASASLTRRALDRARREVEEHGDPALLGERPLSRVLDLVGDALDEARLAHLPDDAEDALLPPDEAEVLLLSALATSTPALDRALVAMEEYGAAVKEAKRKRAKLPRSYVGHVATFLRAYRMLDPLTHACIVERTEEARDLGTDARLTAFAVDPSVVTDALLSTGGSLHLSGTLAPLEEHRDTIGIPRERAHLSRFPSPFPPDRRLVLVDDEVTTRHEDLARDPEMWDTLRMRLRALRDAHDRNMAVFTASHDALRRIAPALMGRDAYIERAGDTQERLMDLVDAFRGARGATLASVIGGRISEGLDFPGDDLEVVVVVGLPYARPSAKQDALVRFHERVSGRGWEYGVKVPMTRRVLQSAGRLIRAPTDRGVVVLMDRRAAMLRDALPELRVTSEPAREVRAFFARD